VSADAILAERRMRSAELALAGAQRRAAEAEAQMEGLRRRVAELERSLAEAGAAGAVEVARLEARLEGEGRARLALEQTLAAERVRGDELEAELRSLRRASRVDEFATRQLAEAHARTEQMGAELEVVRRRAAEFEQSVRIAVTEAWAWLGEASERLRLALQAVEQAGQVAAEAPGGPIAEEPAEAPGEAPATPQAGEEGQRFDEALARLRAQVVTPPEDES